MQTPSEHHDAMIASNNDAIDVDELMRRVRDEVAAMRALALVNGCDSSAVARDTPLPQIVVDLSRHAVISELIEDAKSSVATTTNR